MAREQILGSAPATTLAGAINNSVTSFSITSGTGWPTGSPGPFVATIDRGLATEEKVLITSRSGTSLTGVTRAYDGSTAQAHANLATIEHTISATMLDEANRVVNEQQGNVGYAAGTTNARTSKATGDSNPRFTIDASGKMLWGSGSGAQDVQIQRLAADQLELQDELRGLRAAAANLVQSARVSGDTQDRFELRADGQQNWGPGNGAVDLNLYRASAAKLKTDNALEVAGAFTGLSTAVITGLLTASNFKRGAGAPEGVITGSIGDIYERNDGGTGTTLYIKESGAGNTGWVPVASSRNKTLFKSYADAATSTTPTDVDLVTQALAAGDVAAGEMLAFTLWGDFVNSSGGNNNFNAYLKLGATKGPTHASQLMTVAAAGTGRWFFRFLIAFNALNAERIIGDGITLASSLGSGMAASTDFVIKSEMAVDFTSGANVIFGVSQSGAGTITSKGWILERIAG